MRRKKRVRMLLAVLLGVGALGASVFMAGRWALYGSLARTSGEVRVAGLSACVEITIDGRGVATIRGSSYEDALAGLGFLHAQERLFQMDLGRRMAGGRLSELVGGAALESDIRTRMLGFHRVADEAVELMPPDMCSWLVAYTRGVNAGIQDLGVRPPEYWLLGQEPEAWTAADCVLAALTMHDYLSLSAPFELMQAEMEAALPGDVVAFLLPEVGRFDRQVVSGGASGEAVAPYPSPGSMREVRGERSGDATDHAEPVRGSNGWVVSGEKTAHGGAILANDMHLGLGVPSTWYRVMLVWEEGGETRRVVGVSLPGVPGVVVGATDDLAWGFTNVTGDFQDYIPVDDAEYERATVRREVIRIKGEADYEIDVRVTAQGPVVDEAGRLAMAWAALDAETMNLNVLRMASARSLEEGIAVGRSWWGPPQNMMLAARGGRIGWVMTGYLPERVGYDGVRSERWEGAMDEAKRGMVVDPRHGYLATANQRTLPVDQSRRFGTLWSLGVRAARIGDVLSAPGMVDEAGMLGLQLDTRVEVLDLYRDVVLELAADEPLLGDAFALAQDWDGHAAADDRAAVLLEGLRVRLHEELIEPLAGGIEYGWFMREEVLQRVLRDRPGYMLPEGEASWDGFVLGALLDTIEEHSAHEGDGLSWGETNRAAVRHPLSAAVPALSWLLDMPADALAGHRYSVRVQTPSFGASERLVVSPGRLEEALFHMPGGQSGHPLSRHYRDGFDDWIKGRATPLLPGETVHAFSLVAGE